VKFRRFLLRVGIGGALACAVACGPAGFGGKLSQAVRKQNGLNNQTQDLWVRNPSADAGDPSLTVATARFDQVPRTSVVLTDVLDPKLPLEGTKLQVYASTAYQFAPSLFDWAGERIPWEEADFHIFNSFHHVTLARSYAATALSDLPAVDVYKDSLVVYAVEEGAFGSTAFSPSEKSIWFEKATLFDGKPDYKTADDADVIYHEFAHFLQNQINPDLQSDSPSLFLNYLQRSLREGLADFSAAAVLGDDRTNAYPMAHVNLLGASAVSNMDAATYSRSVRNTVAFPESFAGKPLPCYETVEGCQSSSAHHSDGRVVAGALNDLRRLLMGQSVDILHCTTSTELAPCTVTLAAPYLSEADAWMAVFRLAHQAYGDLNIQSSLHYYGKRLAVRCLEYAWCSGTATSTALKRILVGRGLVSGDVTSGTAQDAPTTVIVEAAPAPTPTPSSAAAPALSVGYRVLSEGKYFANSDDYVDPCEGLLIWPNFTVAAQANLYSVSVQIKEISGFQNLIDADGNAYENTLTPLTSFKVFGWMSPSESTSTLINTKTSRWYTLSGGQTFASYPTGLDYAENTPAKLSAVSWAVRAPANRSTEASVKWLVTYRVYNSDTVPSSPVTKEFRQNLWVSSATGRGGTGEPVLYDFCPEE